MKTRKILTSLSLALTLLILTLSLIGCFEKESYDLDNIPEYSGKAYVEINGNVPFFEESEIKVSSLEEYESLDALGRCGVAYACIGKETMPTEDREEIGSVTPSGWEYRNVSNNNQYDFISGGYIYNRCHLIGFQLAGENANERNLITGTKYLNIEGMLPFENQVANYVKATGNHVLYRVTPIFDERNLVASGVLIEGISVEDKGEDLKFCVYAFNVQPGVNINYFTGQNVPSGDPLPPTDTEEPEVFTYIINKKSKTVHLSTCGNAASIAPANREQFEGELELLLEEYVGYKGCGSCLPDLIIPSESEGGGEPCITYIINTGTKKYHLPSCSGLPTLEENRVEYTGSLADLLNEYKGYSGCGICKPQEQETE